MSENNSHHVVLPSKYYVLTFIALLFLTFLTVWIAQFDFGSLTIYIAMLVASFKAFLVLYIFMGLGWNNGFIKLSLFFALIFFGIFLSFVLADVATRGSVESIEADKHSIQSPVKIITRSKLH
jgi:cytochrome c oxidase subunit 4